MLNELGWDLKHSESSATETSDPCGNLGGVLGHGTITPGTNLHTTFDNLKESEAARLVLFLALGKALVVLAVAAFARTPDVFQGLGTKWDSDYYEIIATQGYGPAAPLVFSPAYPAAIKGLDYLVGNAWVSALLVTNLLSFAFPILVWKAFGYRTALFAELFPTYIVFTTVAYSDVVPLVLLGATFLLLARERVLRASLALGGAIFAFYSLALTLPSFLVALSRKKRAADLLFYALPLAAVGAILLWYEVETGGYLSYIRLEAPWQAGFGTPLAQVQYLLCPHGQGTLTCQKWELFGVPLTPPYWVVRNLLFEAFYVAGALYLLRNKSRQRAFLSVYSLSVVVPLLFVTGVPAMSIPRLLLPAFPVFVGYSDLLRGTRTTQVYITLSLAAAAFIGLVQYFSFFA